ncbi:MAG: sugar ABC transporter permease [Verrucomicrobia bacterium]|nr:sugar ABC transporter permease [Verrucomicrobiota bacterium]
MLVFALFVLLPATQTWVDSVVVWKQGRAEWLGLGLYKMALADGRFQRALGSNLVYFLWTLLFEVVAGLMLALGLERNTRWNQWLRVIFFAPAVLSMVVVGLVFGFLFKDGVGLLPGWLNEGNALLTVSLISGWASAGFFMVIFLGGLAGIPEDVLEAARLDGASAWQTFWFVKLPLLREVVYVALLVCFTGAFKAFDLFWVLFRNQEEGTIVGTLLVREFFQYGHPAYGSALSAILAAVVTAGTILGMKALRWGLDRSWRSR